MSVRFEKWCIFYIFDIVNKYLLTDLMSVTTDGFESQPGLFAEVVSDLGLGGGFHRLLRISPLLTT